MLQQSLTDRVRTKIPWFLLAAITSICGIYGWMLAPYPPLFALIGTVSIALAVAGVRACYQAGFPVWSGLWSLTFGIVFIELGTLTSIGASGWAIALLAIGAGIFALELGLRKILAVLTLSELDRTQIFLVVATFFIGSIISGWIAHALFS